MLLCSVALIAVGLFGDFGEFKSEQMLATLSPTKAQKLNEKNNKEYTKKETETSAYTAHGQHGGEAKAMFILNSGNKVFHNPWCGYADKIDEENLEFVNISRDDLLQNGCRPCGKCNP